MSSTIDYYNLKISSFLRDKKNVPIRELANLNYTPSIIGWYNYAKINGIKEVENVEVTTIACEFKALVSSTKISLFDSKLNLVNYWTTSNGCLKVDLCPGLYQIKFESEEKIRQFLLMLNLNLMLNLDFTVEFNPEDNVVYEKSDSGITIYDHYFLLGKLLA